MELVSLCGSDVGKGVYMIRLLIKWLSCESTAADMDFRKLQIQRPNDRGETWRLLD